MGTRPLPRPLAEQAIAAVNSAAAAGYRIDGIKPSAFEEASRKLGINTGTLYGRLRSAARLYGLEPDAQPSEPDPPPSLPLRPRVRVKAISQPDDAPIYRVLAIGDVHDGPGLPDKSRFIWMARHACEMRPDTVVQIGDFATFDSLNRFDRPGSLPQKVRPSFMRDMDSLEEALSVFYKHAPDGIVRHLTLGNHCTRPLKYESGDASIEGALWPQVTDLFARYNWRLYDEGHYLFIGNVAFVHSPRTIMNREYGGKTMNAVANDSMHSTVYGHTHRGQVLHAPKHGPLGGVTLVNLGTCLPTGYVADYAKVATTSWTYGVYELTIKAGQIIGHAFISMRELERRYS